MSSKRYTEECKIAAVKQVAQRGHPVSEVAERLGVKTMGSSLPFGLELDGPSENKGVKSTIRTQSLPCRCRAERWRRRASRAIAVLLPVS